MKYLTKVGNVVKPKNKLDQAIHDFLVMNDRKLIEASCVEKFKENVISNILFFSQENKRCKMRVAHWFTYGNKTKDFGLTCIPTIQFSLIEIKGIAEFNLNKD